MKTPKLLLAIILLSSVSVGAAPAEASEPNDTHVMSGEPPHGEPILPKHATRAKKKSAKWTKKQARCVKSKGGNLPGQAPPPSAEVLEACGVSAKD